MPEYEELLQLNVVSDDDTGMYRIGEIDGGFNGLRSFLQDYGEEGRDELLITLANIQSKVINSYNEINSNTSYYDELVEWSEGNL